MAFLYQDGQMFILENGNIILRLSVDLKDGAMRLLNRYHVEDDDDSLYYVVRDIRHGPCGIVVNSDIHDKKTQKVLGARLREYKSFGEKPKEIFKYLLKDPETSPSVDILCSYDATGNHYILNNCAGLSNILKIPPEGGASMRGAEIPPGVKALGEKSGDSVSWAGLRIDSDGHIFASSSDKEVIMEYSPEGQKIRNIGSVGFGEGKLLAPAKLSFVGFQSAKTPLLTVASTGNRAWVQYDSKGDLVGTISPLEMNYPFTDILVNKVYQTDDVICTCISFDLVNKSLMLIRGGGITTVSTYGDKLWWRFSLLSLAGLLLLVSSRYYTDFLSYYRTLRIPFLFKLVLLFVPLIVVSSSVTGRWVRSILKEELESESVRRSADMAHAIISSISVDDLKKIQNPEDRGAETYEKIFNAVERIAKAKEVEFTPDWILHKIHGGRYYFGISNWRGAIYEPFIVPRDREMFFRALTEKKPQCGRYMDDQGEWFSYLRPITDENGKVINVLELYRPTESLSRTDREIAFKVRGIILTTVIVAVIMLMIFSYFFTRPLRRLILRTGTVSKGDFEHLIDASSNDELGDLARSFNSMVVDLKKYMNDLSVTTSQKEKIESELRIAHEIQMSIIPNIFPAFPDRPEFDIHAILVPAKQVGGDLYDFFFIDKEHLCFAIGDVSGKGVPASLFMAITRTLLRVKAFECLDAGVINTEINLALCPGNERSMFVTFFVGILNTRTGEVKYSNAGHNPPYVVRGNNVLEKLGSVHGMPLGIFDTNPYRSGVVTLHAGDKLFLFTDGVTEAVDMKGVFYDDKRLEASLDRSSCLKAEHITKLVYGNVVDFAGEAEQADDITIVALNFHGAVE